MRASPAFKRQTSKVRQLTTNNWQLTNDKRQTLNAIIYGTYFEQHIMYIILKEE
jgi:hypothetical protein